ncbi:YqjF family protein [Paenibacillus lautus]|uniref:YqjF family protein n=1 Tax=Paenibacillus lautus TaxID=1401 RepID=UPI000BBDC494|nr:DUF2071 domain-containing protein [Paenibacillus lautus]PCL93345.1 hypothetical protein CPZ30_07800 [Paenibacillus lautus]
MKNEVILSNTDHRPFPLPHGPWLMKQGWNDVLCAHWPVSENVLRPLIPDGLELEKHNGSAWLTVIPFRLSPLRLRGLPPIPFVQDFLELNVRTYVSRKGKPGIYFFNLEASNSLAVKGARTFAHLPYHHARMSIRRDHDSYLHYTSMRSLPQAEDPVFIGSYKPVNNTLYHAEPGSLVHWLTERYCLFTTTSKGKILTGDIHHFPWPLQEVQLQLTTNQLTHYHGFELQGPPAVATYTRRLEALFWPLRKC